MNLATGAILATLHIGDRHEFVGFSEGRVWVASGSVWVANSASGTVSRIALSR